jgi:hypothetical protein
MVLHRLVSFGSRRYISVQIVCEFAIYIRFIQSVIEVNMTQYIPVNNVHPLTNN